MEPDALTLRHFLLHTVAHEIAHLDGTVWRTLRTLFTRPGKLSLEYSAGRRRPYINPFRLLLISIVVYALVASSGLSVTLSLGPVIMSMAPISVRRSLSVEATIEQLDRYGLIRAQFAAKQPRLTGDAAREQFHDRLNEFAEPASFANVILLAVALQLIFFRERRRFLEHAAFSMNVVSFVLLSSIVLLVAIRLRFWMRGFLFPIFGLVALWQFGYLAVAIRRFYLATGRWGNRLLSVAVALVIYMLNGAFMTGVQIAGAAIALAMS